MAGLRLVLDSNVLIDLFEGIEMDPVVARAEVAVSVITKIEVSVGEPSVGAGYDWSRFSVIPIDRRIEAETIRIRKYTRLKLPDTVILATAMVHGDALATEDDRMANAAGNFPIIRPRLKS